MEHIRDFKSGQQSISAQHINRMVDACNAVNNIIGDGYVTAVHTSNGLSLGLNIDKLLERMPKLQNAVKFGIPVTDFTTGKMIELAPCNEDGDDLGDPNVWVHTTCIREVMDINIADTAIFAYVEYDTIVDESGTDVHGVAIGMPRGTHDDPALMDWDLGTAVAYVDEWDRTNQGANDGVDVTIQTRTVFRSNGDGTGTVYTFYRDFRYDSRGKLWYITDEAVDSFTVTSDDEGYYS